MAHKSRPERIKSRVPEDVIRVLVCIDDIEDRFVGSGSDGGQQTPPNRHAAAGVNDGHPLFADDEADIGDIAQVLLTHQGDLPHVGEHAGREFLDRQGRDGLAAKGALRREREHGDEQSADEPAQVPD